LEYLAAARDFDDVLELTLVSFNALQGTKVTERLENWKVLALNSTSVLLDLQQNFTQELQEYVTKYSYFKVGIEANVVDPYFTVTNKN